MPRPPFGLTEWSDTAADVAIAIQFAPSWVPSGLADVAAVIAQLPAAATFPSGTFVTILAGDDPPPLLQRLFTRAPMPVARATRGNALLIQGYRRLGGGIDPVSGIDLAWGYA